ncbi:MAG: transposase [Bacillus sp. (in: firmicutes)]
MVEENLPAMWLAALQKPDYRIINRFRTQQMGKLLPSLFEGMIHQLLERKLISIDTYFLDGTKIETNANKYSFVWKKATTKYEAKLQEKIDETYRHIQIITLQESQELTNEEKSDLPTPEEKLDFLEETLAEMVEKDTEEIEREKDSQVRKEKRSALRPFKKLLKDVQEDSCPRLKKYREQNALFGDRNSYSNTDTDATFMRMKEDHMKNGQLKAWLQCPDGHGKSIYPVLLDSSKTDRYPLFQASSRSFEEYLDSV